MNSLVRYLLKIISTASLWVFIFIVTLSHVYSFDITEERVDLTLTRFLDSLSYKYKGFDIKILGIHVAETYDDNISFSDEDKEEDLITHVGFELGVNYEGKTRSFELAGKITDQIFAKQPEQNNVTQFVNLNFKNEFSKRDRISLKNVFEHFEAPSSGDTTAEGYYSSQFGRTAGRFEYFKNKFDIAYSYDIAKQSSLFVKYANEINIFSGTDRENSLLNKPGFGLSYTFSPTATIFSFSYDFTSIQFENETNATINTIGAGIRQYITKKLYFNGGTGIDLIDSFDNENLSEPFFLASLTYILEEKTQASILFDKKYTTNPYFADIWNSWRTSASLTRQILKRLGCSLLIFYGDGKIVSSGFEQNLLGLSSSLRYDISRNLKGTLTYTYTQSDTNDESSEYSKNTLFLGLIAEF